MKGDFSVIELEVVLLWFRVCGRFLIGSLESAVEIGGGPDTGKESVKTSPPSFRLTIQLQLCW